MDVEELTNLAARLSPADFAARYPHPFLLFYEEANAISPVQFETELATRSRSATSSPAGSLRVLPVAKAPGNPYGDRISVGRARNCDVVLRHGSVSKLHAHIRQDPDGTWFLLDNDSHNGTALAGKPVLAARPAPLHSGDLVTFGAITLRLVDAAELHQVLSRLLAISKPR